MDEFRVLWSDCIVEFRSLLGGFVVVVHMISIVFVVVDSLSFAPSFLLFWSKLLVIPCYTNGFT
jgi:hypothetical protein